MFTALKKIWYYTKLFFTTILEIWRFLAILFSGAGLGLSGEYIYMNLKSGAETWNMFPLATGGFSLILAVILFFSGLSKHIRAEQTKEKVKEYETPPTIKPYEHIIPKDQTYFPRFPSFKKHLLLQWRKHSDSNGNEG